MPGNGGTTISITQKIKRIGRRLFTPAMATLILGNIPTVYQLTESFRLEAPFFRVAEARDQLDAYQRNLDCLATTEAIMGSPDGQTTAYVCPSGDVLVNFSSSEGPVSSWVIRDRLVQDEAGLMTGSAMAMVKAESPRLAQAFSIICQTLLPDNRVIRRIRYADGQCWEQVINAANGQIISSSPSSCDANCR